MGECGQCGNKHFGDGCSVSVDYDSSCDNRLGELDSVDEVDAVAN